MSYVCVHAQFRERGEGREGELSGWSAVMLYFTSVSPRLLSCAFPWVALEDMVQ